MCKQFMACGYSESCIYKARQKVSLLNREQLLFTNKKTTSIDVSPLVFVVNYCFDVKVIKKYFNSFNADFKLLFGDRKILFSMKRNSNTAALLFNKYGFAQTTLVSSTQRCESTGCNSCVLKGSDLSFFDVKDNFTIKPSNSLNCKSENVIYLAVCNICKDFYFGQTMTQEHIRMNGHRSKFNKYDYDKSALAMHIYRDHPNYVGDSPQEGLKNYTITILESSSPQNLRRRESYYIWITKADLRHLNRYKVTR